MVAWYGRQGFDSKLVRLKAAKSTTIVLCLSLEGFDSKLVRLKVQIVSVRLDF